MVEDIRFFDMSEQTERMKRFGHFEMVIQEKISRGHHNVIHNLLPWVIVDKVGAEMHYFQRRFQNTDIGTNDPWYIAHQYSPRKIDGAIYEGRAIIALNPNLLRIESVTRLTQKGNEPIKKRKWKKRNLFMINPEQGMIIKGKGLTKQEVNVEIFWIPPGYTFDQLFPGYLDSLST